MSADIIYVKLSQNSQVGQKIVRLKDVGEILCADKKLQNRLRSMELCRFTDRGEKRAVFSVGYVIQRIQQIDPALSVQIIGDTDFIVDYQEKRDTKKLWDYLKTAFVGLVLFFGSGFTIMTFNTDVSVGEVFSRFYELMTGSEQKNGSLLEITYNIGIAIGILGFYNHFSSKRERMDPTPLHVDMRNFEKQLNQTIITNACMDQSEKNGDQT